MLNFHINNIIEETYKRKNETVWLNTEQIARLFKRDYKTIRKHIKNALKEELSNSTVAKFAQFNKKEIEM